MKKTKIVSTLGPASNDIETITKLAEAGANIFRFQFFHTVITLNMLNV